MQSNDRIASPNNNQWIKDSKASIKRDSSIIFSPIRIDDNSPLQSPSKNNFRLSLVDIEEQERLMPLK